MEDGVLLKIRRQTSRNNKTFRQLVVPQSIKAQILEICHENFTGGHLGEHKTWTKLNNRFVWKESRDETVNYVKSCKICAKIKSPTNLRAPLKPIVDFDRPFDKLGVEILELTRSSSGNKYVVVLTDYLKKWVEAFPLRNMTAEAVATIFINEIECRHSAPRELLSDQGAQFF
jgi:hypothetical protein